MKKLFFVLLIAFPISSLADETVATCKDPSGYSNYHYSGFITKEKSGVVDDKITGGITTLVKTGANEYDLLFTDKREKIISTNGDGGKVLLARRGENDATFLVMYPGMAIELYTFYIDTDGKERFDMLQSKGGDGMPIHKSTMMTGNCSSLDLKLLP